MSSGAAGAQIRPPDAHHEDTKNTKVTKGFHQKTFMIFVRLRDCALWPGCLGSFFDSARNGKGDAGKDLPFVPVPHPVGGGYLPVR
jgi:hypothetical protein